MVFWCMMLLFTLMIPAVMIGFGRSFFKRPPRDINATFCYRTTMSMKNQETWQLAHRVCGRYWFICGLILLRGAWTSGGGAGLLYGLLGALMLVWALFLNEIRAWLVGRFVMKGVARHTARFTDEGYDIANQRGEQSFDYSSVQALCEDGRYFFLMLSRQQGNLFDKQGFHTGTADQFRAFLERKTGQTMKKL